MRLDLPVGAQVAASMLSGLSEGVLDPKGPSGGHGEAVLEDRMGNVYV